jgi:hypothetical protein
VTGIAVWPPNINAIGAYAFEECYSLSHIILPSSITEIEIAAFYKCSNLISWGFCPGRSGSDFSYIGDAAFEYCYKLEMINLSDTSTGVVQFNVFNEIAAAGSITSTVTPNYLANNILWNFDSAGWSYLNI